MRCAGVAWSREGAGARQGAAALLLFFSSCLFLCSTLPTPWLPPQLSLWVCRWDSVQRKWVNHSGKEHVEALWTMNRDRRLRVWEALGRFEALEVLELGTGT